MDPGECYCLLAAGVYDRKGFTIGLSAEPTGLTRGVETRVWACALAPCESAKLVLLFMEIGSAENETAILRRQALLRQAVSLSFSTVGVGAAIGCTLAALEHGHAATDDDGHLGAVSFELQADPRGDVRCIGVGYWRETTVVARQGPDDRAPYRARVVMCGAGSPRRTTVRIDGASKLRGSALEPCNQPKLGAGSPGARLTFRSLVFPPGLGTRREGGAA
jgi:hypothetical protein